MATTHDSLDHSKTALGAYGEGMAARYLSERGMTILDRNWRCSAGEIDLVARDEDGVIVIVEVKTRSGTGFGSPERAVDRHKYQRLRRLGARWLAENPSQGSDLRIDVVAVVTGGGSNEVRHLSGVFL